MIVCCMGCLWAQQLAGFNVGRSVGAGGRGGGVPVPGSCSRAAHFIFTSSAMWGKQHGGIFFAGTLGLGLLARIGTADEGKCYAADATMSTVGVMLDGGMQLLGHTPHTFP